MPNTVAPRQRRPLGRYFELVQEFPLRAITNERDYRSAMRQLRRFAGKPKLDAGTNDYLATLVRLIEAFEKSTPGYSFDTSSVSAGRVVKHVAAENGLSISALARQLKLDPRSFADMANGKREWSKTAIKAFCARFRLNPRLFDAERVTPQSP